MVQVEFRPEVEAKVREYAREWDTTESALLEQVIMRWIEDQEDYARGMRSLLQTKHTISLEEMRSLSDVAD